MKWVPEEGVYEEADLTDGEARDLIDFLGLNDSDLWQERATHVGRLIELLDLADWAPTTRRQWLQSYLTRHPEELHFPTALSAALGMDLTPFPSQP